MMQLGRISTVACVVAGLAVAGCGSSSSSSSGGDPVSRAAFVSTGASGYQMSLSMQISSGALPSPITATGHGAFDIPDHTGSVSIDMNLGNIPQVQQALGSSILRLEEVISGRTIYVKLPTALTSRIPQFGGKPWVKIDLAKAGSAAGVPGLSSLASNPTSSDPSQLLQFLRATSGGSITKVGTESVNGIQTTEYRAKINLDRVPNTLPAARRASAQQAIAALERVTNLHQIPVDVWIDNQNLVRRMRLSFSETASGQSVGVSITINILKYGPQPRPPLPPADQVFDASGLSGSSG